MVAGPGKSARWFFFVLAIMFCDLSESREPERRGCSATDALSDAVERQEWDDLARQVGEQIRIYEYKIVGSDRKERIARGVIESPPWRVFATVVDYDNYEEFMPYTVESRIIRQTVGTMTVFQRLEFSRVLPVADRVYFIDVVYDEIGVDYYLYWTLAKDTVDVSTRREVVPVVNNGYWDLRAVGDGTQTLASYCVDTDPGGHIPAFVANFASSNALPAVVEAVRERVKSHTYDGFAPAR